MVELHNIQGFGGEICMKPLFLGGNVELRVASLVVYTTTGVKIP